MRKAFLFMMISLDGFFEGENHDISWHTVDEEFNTFAIDQLEKIGTLVFGRKTYELMSSYWPTEEAVADDEQVATLMNSLPKAVFSKSLEKSDWKNTQLFHHIADFAKLKEQEGKEIGIFGSNNLTVRLVQEGLLDEARIMISPTVIGKGTSLFHGLEKKLNMKLQNVRNFKNGNVLLTFQIQAKD